MVLADALLSLGVVALQRVAVARIRVVLLWIIFDGWLWAIGVFLLVVRVVHVLHGLLRFVLGFE